MRRRCQTKARKRRSDCDALSLRGPYVNASSALIAAARDDRAIATALARRGARRRFLFLLRQELDLIDRGRSPAQQRPLQEPRPDERRQPEARLHLHEVRDASAFALGRERPLRQRVFEVAAFGYRAGSNKLRRHDLEALDAAHALTIEHQATLD